MINALLPHSLRKTLRNAHGFTLMETLIVMSFVAFVLILLLMGLRIQITRGYDARRKSDLTRIRRAFEEYYNDNDCYPPATILDNCGSADLAPYIDNVPCDPITGESYVYVPLSSDQCGGYAACVALGDLQDKDIERIGCNPINGCGWGSGYNYCIANGMSVIAPGFDPDAPSPTPTGTPTPPPGVYACSPAGNGTCNNYGANAYDPPFNCPVTYSHPGCVYLGTDQCLNQPDNWCDL